MSVRLLGWALALQLLLAGVFIYFAVTGFPFMPDEAPAKPAPRTARFDAGRAYADVRAQVARGPRPAGSRASRELAGWLRERLPNGRFERVGGGLRNVVGTLPGSGPAIVVGAHYDTKDEPGLVGANDGAAGTAVVLELARVLARERRSDGAGAAARRARPELRFVLFDGEELPRGVPERDFLRRGLRGSRAYARRHAGELGAVIVVDFVGQRGLRLPRERGSDARLWSRLRAAARRVGVGAAFPDETVGEIYDDHTPFARAGVPAIDLIDFDYDCFHRACDTLDQVDVASLDAVGEAVTELLRAQKVPMRFGGQ